MWFRVWRYRPNSARGYLPKPGSASRKQRIGGPIQQPSGFMARFLVLVFLLSLVFTAILALLDVRLKPTVIAFAEAKGRAAATQAINSAIHSRVAQTIRYEDLMAIKTDSRGKVSLVQPNTGEINRLASVTVMEIQNSLRKLKQQRFGIPMGQILGSQVFAAMGPRIWVSVIPVGSVTVDVNDDFEQAGINQTRHKIYLVVKTVLRVVIPLVARSVTVDTRVPLTEAIIMGEVPQVYLGNGKNPATTSINVN